MARIEHIKQRLDNWALWRARMQSGGLGYHAVNILACDVWSRGSYNGSRIPHIDADAEKTEQAVQSLKLSRSHLHETLDCIYLRELGVAETARRMRRSPSTIHAQLGEADRAIDAWLRGGNAYKDHQTS